jgi:hypothetical protein
MLEVGNAEMHNRTCVCQLLFLLSKLIIGLLTAIGVFIEYK